MIKVEEDGGEIFYNQAVRHNPCLLRSPPYWSGSIVILRLSKKALCILLRIVCVSRYERLQDAAPTAICLSVPRNFGELLAD